MNYLAIDLGAENGRIVLGSVQKGKIILRELHRFPNRTVFENGHWRWDIQNIFSEIKKAIKIAGGKKIKLSGIGVDAWGVDFGLVGKSGKMLENPVSYRDNRTDGVMEKVLEKISRENVYKQTGIQFLSFNTIYQLYAAYQDNPKLFDSSKKLLFIPDIFNFLLTGKMQSENTIASTSQLFDIRNTVWASKIFKALNLPQEIMLKTVKAGKQLGQFVNIPVFAVGSHDTASAVAAVPANDENWAFLSSGTWSLMGVELHQPIVSKKSLEMNWTNELGVNNTFRFLKNITGLWLLEQCKRQWEHEGKRFLYGQLLELAETAPKFRCLINVNDPVFLHPKNMPEAIANFCEQTEQPVPKNEGEFARCILESLALEYKNVLRELEGLIQKNINTLHIVGGGARNRLLNQLTANATGKKVTCGPIEATAIGNILVQATASGEFGNLAEARRAVRASFNLETLIPQKQNYIWQEAFLRYNVLKSF